jgi:acetyltransferase-like isoleucine patch superfamily enzyme
MTLSHRLLVTARRWLHSRRGIRFGADARIERQVRIRRGIRASQPGAVTLGASIHLEQGVIIDAFGGSVRIGENVYVGPYSVIYGHGGVEIGDGTLLSMHCRVLSSDHTVPAPSERIRDQPDILKATRIGRDVWLGAGVTVLGGVVVGDGCVVGAGAVVADDLPPYSVAVGVPARVIKSREGLG